MTGSYYDDLDRQRRLARVTSGHATVPIYMTEFRETRKRPA